MTNRCHESKIGKNSTKTSENDYHIHIGDIVQYTAKHAVVRPDQISNKSAMLVAHHARSYEATSKPAGKLKTEIDWDRRLPRTLAQVLSMPTSNLDHAGFL